MSEEFGDFVPVQEPERSSLSDEPLHTLDSLKQALTTAGALFEGDPDLGDFTPDGAYKGFPILASKPTAVPATHQSLPGRFYVKSPLGAVGLVPWVGSKIVWPWEAGWVQDLHRTTVTSFLKEKKETKKR